MDLALKKKEILSHATTWMNLKDIKLSEISWPQKTHAVSSFHSRKVVKFIGRERRMVICQGLEEGETESCLMV